MGTDTCHNDSEHGPAVRQTKLCAACVQDLTDRGWVISATGRMRNPKTGVKVSPTGNVTVQASYNPRMLALLTEELDPADLDDEELARGICRNEDGKFPRRNVHMVPKALYDRMTTELFQRSDDRLRNSLVDAVESITKIMMNDEIDASTRIKAATWVFERLRGKTPEVVEIRQDKPYQMVLSHIHRGPRERPVAEEETPVEASVGPAERPRVRGARPTRGPR